MKEAVRLFQLLTPLFLLLVLIFLCPACRAAETDAPNSVNVIPKPASVSLTGGEFVFLANTEILVEDDSSETLSVGRYLSDRIGPATGLSFPVLKHPALNPCPRIFVNKKTGNSTE